MKIALIIFSFFLVTFARAAVTLDVTTTGTVYSNTITVNGTITITKIEILGSNVSRVTYSFGKVTSPEYPNFYNDYVGAVYVRFGSTGPNSGNPFVWNSGTLTRNIVTSETTIVTIEANTQGTNSATSNRIKTYTILPNAEMGTNQPQSVSLSPNGGAAAIVRGQTFSGTASGAQAGNAYNISVISGQGSASINSSTGAYTVTANGAGLIHYKVWISAGSGYDRSPDAEANIAVTASKKVKITIPANNGQYSITYTLWQDGVILGTFIQVAGASAVIQVIDVAASGGMPYITGKVNGIVTDGVSFTDGSGSVDSGPVIIDNIRFLDDEEVNDAPAATVTPVTTPVKNNSPNVTWSTTQPNSATGDALTNGVYREGVQKIVGIFDVPAPEPIDDTPQINQIKEKLESEIVDANDNSRSVRDNAIAVKEHLSSKTPMLVDVSGSQMVYSLPFGNIAGMGNVTVDIDLNKYSFAIGLMRNVMKVLFLIFMWFVYARTFRASHV